MVDYKHRIFDVDILGEKYVLKIENVNTDSNERLVDFTIEIQSSNCMNIFMTNYVCEYECYNRLISSFEHVPKFHYSFEEKNDELILLCKNDYVKTSDIIELKRKICNNIIINYDDLVKENIIITKMLNDLRNEHQKLQQNFTMYKSATDMLIDSILKRVLALERKLL